MPIKPIRLFPDPALRKHSRPVLVFNVKIRDLVRDLFRTMSTQPHGIGIAAPQIGILLRVALVDVSARVSGAVPLVMINPVILECQEPRLSREGCMSLPEYTGSLPRYDVINCRWQDEEGNFHEKVSTGIEAVCMQHEIDHLNGQLFLDRISCLKTDMIPRGSVRKRKK